MRSLKALAPPIMKGGRRIINPRPADGVQLWRGGGKYPLTYRTFYGVIERVKRYFVTGTDTEVGTKRSPVAPLLPGAIARWVIKP